MYDCKIKTKNKSNTHKSNVNTYIDTALIDFAFIKMSIENDIWVDNDSKYHSTRRYGYISGLLDSITFANVEMVELLLNNKDNSKLFIKKKYHMPNT